MKSKASFFTSLFSLILLSYSCDVFWDGSGISGNGNVVEMERTVDKFHSISVENGIDVFLTQGDNQPLKVVADENLHDIIRTDVFNGTLVIESDVNIRSAKKKEIYIYTPVLDKININSAGNLKAETPFNVENIEIDLSSAGDLHLELNANHIDLDISSAGNATLSGRANSMDASLSSAGDLNAFNLETNKCKVSVSSSGNAEVFANEEFILSASSAGDIRYRGEGNVIKSESSSAGTIRKVD